MIMVVPLPILFVYPFMQRYFVKGNLMDYTNLNNFAFALMPTVPDDISHISAPRKENLEIALLACTWHAIQSVMSYLNA